MKQFKICLSLLLAVLMAFSCCSVAFATTTAVNEAESNDTLATATAVAYGNYGQGDLKADSDIDWYSVDTTSAGQGLANVTFSFTGGGSTSAYFTVTVYAPDKTTVEQTLIVKGNSSTTKSDTFDAAAGIHYIQVKAANIYSAGKYQVAMTVTAPSCAEKEDNGSWSKASVNTISTTSGYNSKWFHGMLSTASDVDYFEITAAAGYIIADIKQSEGTKGDYKLQIVTIDSSAERILAETSIKSTATDYVSTAEIGVAKGTYYLKVTGTAGGYEIRYYNNASLTSETEINDTAARSNLFTMGGSIYGSMGFAGDIDYFKVVSDGSKNKITVAAAASSSTTGITWNVYLLDSSYATKASGTVTNSQSVEFKMGDYDSGTYYIQISAGSIYGTGNYKISSETYTEESSTSFWDQITKLDWGNWFQTNFGEMLTMLGGSDNRIDLNGDGTYDLNLGMFSLLYSLFELSVGTLVKYFTSE